jgi:type I restriction enzyme, R subunit
MSSRDYNEDNLVKSSAVKVFQEMFKGYNFSFLDVMDEIFKTPEHEGTLGRETKAEVILIKRVRDAIINLNQGIIEEEIKLVLQELLKDRSRLSPIMANKEIYTQLKNGIKIKIKEDEKYVYKTIKIIDFDNPKNNEYFLASEFWVAGEYGAKRADLILFVNGLPLVVTELKRPRKPVREAFDNNIGDYLDTIPNLFWYNAFIMLSNGKESLVGSMTSTKFEDFSYWKKVESEKEKGDTIIDTMLKATCHPDRLLDIIENFILYEPQRKLIAKYHQYIGVNDLIKAFENRKKLKGKLGIFWHTQRSGKTNSMAFFAQKILRKYSGNYTFVFVTDRKSLDSQIYNDFQLVDSITEVETQAKDGAHLKKLLKEDHRMIFTIINKFNTKKGEKYPLISERDDIIVITDEAHRTQYDTFAINMRTALPNASFAGFTGTPLMNKGNEKTKKVFGDYVSVYNFQDAIDDGVTVKLFYENRADPLKLNNPQINREIYDLIDEDLTPEQEKKLSKEFSKNYHILTRNDRLNRVAKDMVDHYTNRGYSGKAMVLCIDRFTTVKMFDKFKNYWKIKIKFLKQQLDTIDAREVRSLREKIKEMEDTDLAVVISKSQNEIKQFQEEGLDIKSHRKRMEQEDLDNKFKNPRDPLRIVFVCHMWLTGFNAPSLSTLYIDKPMKDQSLMQAISRPATAIPGKKRAFLISYLDIFRPLKDALSMYAAPRTTTEGIFSVQNKDVLIDELSNKITDMNNYLKSISIKCDKIIAAKDTEKLRLLSDLQEKGISPLLKNDQIKNKFLNNTKYLLNLFNDCKPDPRLSEYIGYIALFEEIFKSIKSLDPKVDVSSVVKNLKGVLDKSIVVHESEATYGKGTLIDLSRINFDKIAKHFKKTKSNTDIERMKNVLSSKIPEMVKLNSMRTNYLEKFQSMIDEYNLGTKDQEFWFDELLKFSQVIVGEELRARKEGMTEEELALFDKLKKPELSKKEKEQVKNVAKELLFKLNNNGLSAVDWRKKPRIRAKVEIEIRDVLDAGLTFYPDELYLEKCRIIFQHIYDNYFGERKSVYNTIPR